METKKIIYTSAGVVVLMITFAFGIWIGNDKLAYCVQQPGTLDFSLFWDAYEKLKENFIDPNKITDEKTLYGAIAGMTSSLGDPYTDFFDPSQAQIFQQDLSGSFSGIGVEIGVRNDLLTIISPLKDTPGERAGLKPGDIVLKINGKDSTNITTTEAVSLIRGERGTQVVLTIMRDGWNNTKDFKIMRDTIKVDSVRWALRDGDVAYLQIFQFGGALKADFEKVALEIMQSPAKKIVLDLRNNPGGYLDVAQNIAGWFLEKGQIVTIEDFGKGKDQTIYKTDGNSKLSAYPLVILINEGSASASEILAGTLRDNKNIKLIGMKSFGKGSVQTVVDLRGG